MRKNVFVTMGIAALSFAIGSAWAGDDLVSRAPARDQVRKAQRVSRIASYQTINLRTGERYNGQVGGRADTVVYDNTATNSGFAYSDFPDSEMGDDHGLLANGLLDSLSFSVFNGDDPGNPDLTLSGCDVSVTFEDWLFNPVGTVVVEGITFDPPLAPGEAGLVDVTDLSGLGITLPPNVITSFLYSNLQGASGFAGYVWFTDPAIGWSAGNSMQLGNWGDFSDTDGNPIYTDIYLRVGITEPGDLKALASTGSTRVVYNNGTAVYLGYLSGHVDDTRPQRWSAIPFTLTGDSKITEIDAWWFQNVVADEMRYKIWKRTNLDAPVAGDLLLDRYLRPDDVGAGPRTWFYQTTLEEVLELPKGDYYITIYDHSTLEGYPEASVGWLGGGLAQREELEQDFFWRAAFFPDPGFGKYAPATITAPKAMTDAQDLWNQCFTLRGTSVEAPPCVRGDSNGDGQVDFNDIDCFVAALIGPDGWAGCGTQYGPDQYVCANDINQDGSVDFNDIDGFVDCIINGGCQ